MSIVVEQAGLLILAEAGQDDVTTSDFQNYCLTNF
jgi:hypothetical protein